MSELESDGHYEKCPKCGKFAVHLATSATISFYGDSQDRNGNASKYSDEYADIDSDDIDLWAHICFECEHVVDFGVEGGRVGREQQAEVAALRAQLEAARRVVGNLLFAADFDYEFTDQIHGGAYIIEIQGMVELMDARKAAAAWLAGQVGE